MLDVALVKNPATGKFTFDWTGPGGDLLFDDRAVYPVLTTLFSRKGAYYWDSTGQQGTYLHTIKHDVFATGSQLRAAGQDALDQVRAVQIIQGGSVDAERRRPGSWRLVLRWQVHGETVTRVVGV